MTFLSAQNIRFYQVDPLPQDEVDHVHQTPQMSFTSAVTNVVIVNKWLPRKQEIKGKDV